MPVSLTLGFIYTKRRRQRWEVLLILLSLKTIESLQNRIATHFGVIPLYSMRAVSPVSSQHCTLTLGANGLTEEKNQGPALLVSRKYKLKGSCVTGSHRANRCEFPSIFNSLCPFAPLIMFLSTFNYAVE